MIRRVNGFSPVFVAAVRLRGFFRLILRDAGCRISRAAYSLFCASGFCDFLRFNSVDFLLDYSLTLPQAWTGIKLFS